ncbi:MAG: hypothetical protein WDZ83_15405 [Rhizobiaceae bacterium]
MASVFIRLCVILIGYAFAILVASLFLHLMVWPSLGLEGDTPTFAAKSALVVSVLLVGLFVSYYAFVPAAVLIALAELRPYRSWLYFALAGGVTALSALVLHEMLRIADLADARPHPLALDAEALAGALGAGIAAGIAYWLLAGRGAGNWRRRAEATGSGPSVS